MIHHKTILTSIALAPIPTLLILFGLFLGLNSSKNSISFNDLPHILILMAAIWIIYSLLVIPIAYPVSILIQRKNWLNLWVILLGSISIGWLIMLFIQIIFIQTLAPLDVINIILHNEFYPMLLFTGFCYWSLLKAFSRHKS